MAHCELCQMRRVEIFLLTYLLTKQHAVVSIQLNVFTCPAFQQKLIRDHVIVIAPFLSLSVVIVTPPFFPAGAVFEEIGSH